MNDGSLFFNRVFEAFFPLPSFCLGVDNWLQSDFKSGVQGEWSTRSLHICACMETGCDVNVLEKERDQRVEG